MEEKEKKNPAKNKKTENKVNEIKETPKKVGRPRKKQEEPKEEKKVKKEKKVKVETIEEKIEKSQEQIEVITEKQMGFNTLEVIIIIFISLCFGGLFGSAMTYLTAGKSKIITTVPSELREFVQTYEDIKSEYYEEIDEEELVNAGIKGMLDFLGDKYSVYMDEAESNDFNEQINGEYVGIGSEIQLLENGDRIISDPFEDGPAAKAGLQVGDIFKKVDGEDVTSLSLEEIANRVKGVAGTKVTITVQRGEKLLDIVVTRGKVELSSVTSKVYEQNEKKIGYINISIFAANTTAQFEKALLELESQGIEALAIDVRDNTGGYLDTVEEIASLFLKKGKPIYQLDTKGIVNIIRDVTNTSRDYKVAVMTNKASASASEILAAAIQEAYENGSVIGVNSYGKGTVQKAYELSTGATIKYTIQKWLTPNGNWIDGTGVTPTKEVKLQSAYYENPIEENDNQLSETLKFLAE